MYWCPIRSITEGITAEHHPEVGKTYIRLVYSHELVQKTAGYWRVLMIWDATSTERAAIL